MEYRLVTFRIVMIDAILFAHSDSHYGRSHLRVSQVQTYVCIIVKVARRLPYTSWSTVYKPNLFCTEYDTYANRKRVCLRIFKRSPRSNHRDNEIAYLKAPMFSIWLLINLLLFFLQVKKHVFWSYESCLRVKNFLLFLLKISTIMLRRGGI